MSTINRTRLENKLTELLEDGSPDAIREFADTAMFSIANQAYNRAGVSAESFNHGAMDNLHLLAGILSVGETDPDLGVPRTLRSAGLDFSELLSFLGSQTDLQGDVHTGGMPTPSKGLVHTLGEAFKLSQRRAKESRSHGVIITADLVIALIAAAKTDPILGQAFTRAKVDTTKLRKQLRSSTQEQPSLRLLSPVTD